MIVLKAKASVSSREGIGATEVEGTSEWSDMKVIGVSSAPMTHEVYAQ